jgi:hypothetical protein
MVVAFGCTPALPALAVGVNPGGPEPVENTRGFIGRIEFTTPGFGSANLIKPNAQAPAYVLTAAHCLDYIGEERQGGGTDGFIRPRFERYFNEGKKAQRYFALGVQNPRFSALPDGTSFGTDIADIGLLLLLNGQNITTTPGVLGGANDEAVAGETIKFAGYANRALGQAALVGEQVVDSVPNGRDYIFSKFPPSVHWTQPGDSGGPVLKTFNGTEKIVGLNSGGTITTNMGVSTGNFFQVRPNAYRNFILGDGEVIGGNPAVGVINRSRIADGANTDWTTAANWARGSANAPNVPSNGDVAVLDPTSDPNANTTMVTIPLGTPTENLEGLLNDVDLVVRSGLHVTGRSGVLNGGRIRNNNILNIKHSLDNVGEVVNAGNMHLGADLREGRNDNPSYAIWNSGVLDSNGLLTVTNGTGDATFKNAPLSVALIRGFANIDVFQNNGVLAVPAGQVEIGFLDHRPSGVPNSPSVTQVLGFQNAPLSARLDVFRLNNVSDIEVNGGSFRVNPLGFLTNFDNFHNQGAGNLFVRVGTTVTVRHRGRNDGLILIDGNNNAPGLFEVSPGANAARSRFETGGASRIVFSALGADSSDATMQLTGTQFINDGLIRGRGQMIFTGLASFANTRVPAPNADNYNQLDITFTDAGDPMQPGGFTFLEVGSEDVGDGSGAVQGLNVLLRPMALHSLCVTDWSLLRLVSNARNETNNQATEVLYTRYIGLAGNSTLDLNGFKLYAWAWDPNCCDNTGTIINGEIIWIVPEPGIGVVILCGALASIRRKRPSLTALT